MNVLVTGAAGYIGSTLTYLLLEKGYSVIGIDKLLFGMEPLLGAIRHERFRLIACDVLDTKQYEKHVTSDTVIVHLAAIVGEPACKKYETEAIKTNYDGSKAIFSLAKEKSIKKLIFATTCSNYGMVPKGEIATEESSLNPLGLYAQSKVDMEKYIFDTIKNDLNWTILRFSTVQGIGARLRFDLTVNEFAGYGYIDKKLDVFLPHTVRPYVHVFDAARAVLTIIKKQEESRNNVYNVGDSRENYQKQQVVDIVKQFVPDLSITYVDVGEDLRDYCVGFDKIKNNLGFHIIYSVPDGVKEIIDAIKNGGIPNIRSSAYINA
jgi:nucleoside-diphosphate-sugar epimerase